MTPDELMAAHKAKDWPQINAWMAEHVMGWQHPCGGGKHSWIQEKDSRWWRFRDTGANGNFLPCTDLSAVHEAEERLLGDQRRRYLNELLPPGNTNEWLIRHAPAATCCVAMLRAVLTKGDSHE